MKNRLWEVVSLDLSVRKLHKKHVMDSVIVWFGKFTIQLIIDFGEIQNFLLLLLIEI